MIKLIRNIVGRRTLPMGTYMHKKTGEYWVRGSVFIVDPFSVDTEHLSFDTQEYKWQQVRQNKWGKWVFMTSYVTNFDLQDMDFVL